MKLITSLLLVLISALDLPAQKLIPLTSTSQDAIRFYKQAFKMEDQGNIPAAMNYYSKALSEDSSFAMAYMQLALLQEKFTDRTKLMAKAMQFINAVSEGERLLISGRNAFYGNGNRQDEFGFFQKLVELHPEDPYARYLFGFVNHHHGRQNPLKAIEHLEKSIGLDSIYLTALDDLAVAYMEARDYSNAERILLREIKLQPANVKPVDSYGEMLLRKGEYARSIEMYKKALLINPLYPWSIYGMAANLNFLGKHQDARRFINRLDTVKLTERDSYHRMLAYQCSYLDEGKIDSAIVTLEKHGAIARDNNLTTQRFLSLTNKARILFENERSEPGYKAYEELLTFVESTSNEQLKKQTRNQRAYYNAYVQFIAGKSQLARSALQEYIALQGRSDDATKILLARMNLHEKKIEDADKLLRECNQANPVVQYWLAMTCFAAGKQKEAKELIAAITARNEMQELDYHLVRKKALQLL